MRIAVIGAVRFTQHCVDAIETAGHLCGVITLPPDIGKERHPDYAAIGTKDAPVIHIASRDELAPAVRSLQPDHVFVLGWSRLIDNDVRMQCCGLFIGSHPAPLPRGRGRSPIVWAHVLGWRRSALTFFAIGDGPADSGPIVAQRYFWLGDDVSKTYTQVCNLGADMVVEIVNIIEAGQLRLVEQCHAVATTFPKRVKGVDEPWLEYP